MEDGMTAEQACAESGHEDTYHIDEDGQRYWYCQECETWLANYVEYWIPLHFR